MIVSGFLHRILPLFALLLSFAAGTVLAQTPGDLEGAWELVATRVVLPDTTIEEVIGPGRRKQKLLTAGHFAYGQQSDDGQQAYAGGGSYTYDGTTYVETYVYHASPSMLDRSVAFESRLDGGFWRISGIINRFRVEETWQRIE